MGFFSRKKQPAEDKQKEILEEYYHRYGVFILIFLELMRKKNIHLCKVDDKIQDLVVKRIEGKSLFKELEYFFKMGIPKNE